MRRLFWLFLPFFLVCAGLWMAAQRLDDARQAHRTRTPRAPAALPVEPEDQATTTEVQVAAIHADPGQITSNLAARGLASIGTLVDQMNRGELTPIQAVSNVVFNLNDEAVHPVDPARLREVIPESLAGWTRGDITAGPSGGLWMRTAAASVSFRDARGRVIELKVMDTGTMHAVAGAAQELAGAADLVQSNHAGVVRTSRLHGFPLFEKYAVARRKSSAHLFAGQRFIVQAEARGVELAEVRRLMEALDLEPLREAGGAP